MFYRTEKVALGFNRLDFEIIVADAIESVEPNTSKDLAWMVERMVDAVQLVAWEYAQDCDGIDEEWEDVFYPADCW